MTAERGPFFSNPFVARAARWGLLAWSVIGILLLLWVVFRFVVLPIRIIFPPLLVALIVIYLLNPVVTTLQRRGVPRVWGALVTYLLFLGAVGVSLAYLVPVISHQGQSFVHGFRGLLTLAEEGFAAFARRLGLHLSAKDVFASFEPGKGGAFNFLGRLTSYTSGVVRLAVVLALGPLLAFYLLVDLPKIRRGAEALVPASRREEVRELSARINGTLGGFFRGQLLVALIMGATSLLGYWFIGLPYFALMGALTGLLALVPLIGTVIAAVPVLFVAATADHTVRGVLHLHPGWPLSIGSVLVLVLVQQLDTRLLSQRLFKREVRLHPVTVLLSLLIGGTLMGLWGMLLAVPVAAVLKVLVLHVWDTRSSWPPKPPTLTEADHAASVPAPAEVPEPEPDERERVAEGSRVRSV
jgi:predicted PurR-regulated permease PerM